MTLGDAAVPLVLAWLALTVLFQFRPFSRWFRTLDRLGLLPRWLFFTHGVGSYRLLVEICIRDADGKEGMWQPAPLWSVRRWWHAVFLPEHATINATWTATDRLAWRARRGDSVATLAATQAYAILLSHLRRQLPAQEFQFAILRSESANQPPTRLFVSGFDKP